MLMAAVGAAGSAQDAGAEDGRQPLPEDYRGGGDRHPGDVQTRNESQKGFHTMFNVCDEAQREKNSSQVETQTLRGERKPQLLLTSPAV